jgi:glycosyltransferase involved in cell wall biosynthesis
MGMFSGAVQRWPDGELLFAFIGLITEEKGVFDLVEIARLLRDKSYRFTLSIVGEGLPAEISRLNNLIARYNLSRFVQLTGVVIGVEKFRLLQQTTIFLFPSYFPAETQTTALMEALAVGVPVVAYDWGGINTIIDQGVNGYLVPPRDKEGFCRAIEQVLADGNIDRMRMAARSIFLERFTLNKHVEALRQAFRSIE